MAKLRWCRLHADTVNDPKMRLLAFEDRWHFIALLCLKADGLLDQDMSSDLLDRQVAVLLGLTVADAVKARNRLEDVGLVGPDWQPLAWDKRQYQSDTSADRVRRYRETRSSAGLPKGSGSYLIHWAAIYERDGGKCIYCERTKNLCLDHMVPIIKGGTDDIDNLALACKACNIGKAGRTPEECGYAIRSQGAAEAHSRYVTACNGYTAVTVTPPDTDTDTDTDKDTGQQAGQPRSRFDDFWAVYPRKEKKKKAAKIWRDRKLDTLADKIIADVKARSTRCKQWTKDDGQFIPLPTTYLNNDQWDDEWEGGSKAPRDPEAEKRAAKDEAERRVYSDIAGLLRLMSKPKELERRDGEPIHEWHARVKEEWARRNG